jgi:hypothetical protein
MLAKLNIVGSHLVVIFNLFIPAVFTEQYIESMGQSQQTQLYCGQWPTFIDLLV